MTERKTTALKSRASKPAAKTAPADEPTARNRSATSSQGDTDLSSRFYEAFISSSRSVLGDQQSDRRTAVALIQNIATDIAHLAEQSAERFGIHVSDFYVLLLLEGDKPNSTTQVADLQKSLGFTAGGVSRRLDRMEEAGLVKRIRDPKDARAWMAKLTRKGRELSVKIRAQRSPKLEAAYGELSADEWQVLASLLKRVSRSMHSLATEG